jgi:hypothetical protein
VKRYPSIPHFHGDAFHRHSGRLGGGVSWYVFDKLDGSNIRAEWSRKTGFTKFGRRKALLDDSNPFLPEAEELILSKYADALAAVFRKQRWQKVTTFFEFFGAHSFAGNHEVEPHDVVLFDVRPFKQGMLPPRDLLKHFGHLELPQLLHQGPLGGLLEDVHHSRLAGMTFEGVVGKGPVVRQLGGPIMFKVKSQAWYDRLKEVREQNQEFVAQ